MTRKGYKRLATMWGEELKRLRRDDTEYGVVALGTFYHLLGLLATGLKEENPSFNEEMFMGAVEIHAL